MSARDVLAKAMADSFDVGNMAAAVEQLRFEERAAARLDMADEALDALLAHPVELLALLAEPKVCETCEGNLGREWTDDPCPSCHGTGSVAVDVLDLLGIRPVFDTVWCERCAEEIPGGGFYEGADAREIHRDGIFHGCSEVPVFVPKDGTP